MENYIETFNLYLKSKDAVRLNDQILLNNEPYIFICSDLLIKKGDTDKIIFLENGIKIIYLKSFDLGKKETHLKLFHELYHYIDTVFDDKREFRAVHAELKFGSEVLRIKEALYKEEKFPVKRFA